MQDRGLLQKLQSLCKRDFRVGELVESFGLVKQGGNLGHDV